MLDSSSLIAAGLKRVRLLHIAKSSIKGSFDWGEL